MLCEGEICLACSAMEAPGLSLPGAPSLPDECGVILIDDCHNLVIILVSGSSKLKPSEHTRYVSAQPGWFYWYGFLLARVGCSCGLDIKCSLGPVLQAESLRQQ